MLVWLTFAEFEIRGLPGLRDSLIMIGEALSRFWSDIHPQLDPDDDNDPLERVNVVAGLMTPGGPESSRIRAGSLEV